MAAISYPPLWAKPFWAFIHASPWAFREEFTEEERSHVQAFWTSAQEGICHYLPCPACQMHCVAHVSAQIPHFNTWEDYWKWTIQFHNAVNSRIGRRQFTEEQALAALVDQLATYGLKPEDIHQAFLQDYWTVLMLTTSTFRKFQSNTEDKNRAATPDEITRYRTLLEHACWVMPFSKHVITEGLTVREVMLRYLAEQAEDLSTPKSAFDFICRWFNQVCEYFKVLPKTTEEQWTRFTNQFSLEKYVEMDRANNLRNEDHKRIAELEKELEAYRTDNPLLLREGSVSSGWKTTAIVLIALISVYFLVTVSMFMYYRKYCPQVMKTFFGHKRSVVGR